jgi:DNA topoisomerase-1
MAKNLVIVESPAKAKTISKFLGKNYSVKASKGHIRDLPKSSFGVDIEDNFKPKYITIRGKGEIVRELRKAVQKANKIFLATDPDREGEAISWHLAQALGIPCEKPCRIEFNEITKDAIQAAVKKPKPIDMDKVNAQQARRILDRIVGYKISPLLWRKVRRGLSAGRVQSVAVRMICDREEEIRRFVTEEYWTIETKLCKVGQRKGFTAKLILVDENKVEIKNEEQSKAIAAELKKGSFVVKKVKKSQRRKQPPAPFTTSNLQQEAARKLGFTAKKTMVVAQQLYEGLDIGKQGAIGLITYIRTDSTRIAQQAQEEAKEYIIERYGKDYYPGKANVFAAKGKSQDAHEAIRPTSVRRTPGELKKYLTNEQYKLYSLIWERFVASQMEAGIFDTVSVDILAGRYVLRATGSTIKFDGFTVLYMEGKDDEEKEKENLIPDLAENEELKLQKIEPKQHFTQPPPRYTEAMLVKTLEEKGIGRPSTYAPIIDTIQKRGYVYLEQKRFHPTELGEIVVEMLKEVFPDIIDIEFTAKMEEKLDEIGEGIIQWQELLREFYHPFAKTLEEADKKIEAVEIEDQITDQICEKCGRNMVIKYGPYGEFLACPGYPECKNTKPILKEVGVLCPECGSPLVERKSKKGRKFYGCSNYPQCKFVVWNKITDKRCPYCGELLFEEKGKKGNRLVCINKNCSNAENDSKRAGES